jgi:beta-N-acetylhexosaminidase
VELQNGGCVGCLKHFPGLGASRVDSHEELPLVPIEDSELRSVDLLPYKRLLQTGIVHSVMVAHAAYPNVGLQEISPGGKLLPSSLNGRFINELLRTELNFDGLVITDDLEMGAIVKNHGVGEACKMAIVAGADMLAICADPERIREGHAAVLSAVRSGEISGERLEATLARIARAKSLLAEPMAFDSRRLGELSDAIARLTLELEQ